MDALVILQYMRFLPLSLKEDRDSAEAVMISFSPPM
jgi:hypothetical protein